MSVGTVILLPPAILPDQPHSPWLDRRSVAAELMAYAVPVLVVPDAPIAESGLDARTATAHWIAHIAVYLTKAQPEKPVTLVAHGAAGALLPALGFSQKASRRPVAGYVVIDGALPRPGAADWPDAPVTYVATAPGVETRAAVATAGGSAGEGDPVRLATLRGWTVEINADPAAILRALFD